MYETGEGVEQDTDLAHLWYQKAADQGHVAAGYRLTYLDIKQNGYDRNRHAQWLSEVKKNASISKQEVLFLLGQMYREGIGVKKNLNKSLEIMYQLGLEGMAAADTEIEKIQAELKAHEIRRQKSRAARARKQAEKPAVKTAPGAVAKAAPQTPPKASVKTKPQAAPATSAAKPVDEKEARRKRYEAIMKKLAEEQAEIDRLQGLVDEQGDADIDDEI